MLQTNRIVHHTLLLLFTVFIAGCSVRKYQLKELVTEKIEISQFQLSGNINDTLPEPTKPVYSDFIASADSGFIVARLSKASTADDDEIKGAYKQQELRNDFIMEKAVNKDISDLEPPYFSAGIIFILLSYWLMSSIGAIVFPIVFLIGIILLIKAKKYLAVVAILIAVLGLVLALVFQNVWIIGIGACLLLLMFIYDIFKRSRLQRENNNQNLPEEKLSQDDLSMKLKKELFIVKVLGVITVVFIIGTLFWLIFGFIELYAGGAFAVLILYTGVLFAIPTLILFLFWLYFRKQYRNKKAAQ